MNVKKTWKVLAVIGAPFGILIGALIFLLSLTMYLLLWTLVLLCCTTVVAFGAVGIVGMINGIGNLFLQAVYQGVSVFGLSLISLSLCIFTSKPVYFVIKGMFNLTKKIMYQFHCFFISFIGGRVE